MAKGDDLPPPAKKARTADGDAATNGAVGAAAAGTSRPAAAGLPPLAGAAQAAAAVAGGGRHKASEKPSVTQFGELQASVDVLRGLGGGDEAGEGDAEEVEEELQAAVAKLLEARAHKAKRKQQQQLETLKASVEAQVAHLEQAVKRDATEASAALAAMVKALRSKLEAKMRGIQELEARFQKELQDKWEDYNELYSSNLDEIQAQAQKLVAKKAAAHKKRLDAIQADAAAKLAELEDKFTKSRSRSEQLPNLANVLKAYL